ncbi:type IV pilus modification protein PilV [Crenothrix polyspora]|uniref:Putative Type IV pilus modification protein PilV n=1 Tax=Crenothrix polyspora TaxID=360316 RepID=A0A1R4HAU5_9GAMM|nr:type IV pilus modification protein PilV [Crenothrix polyspora]SJM93343.1 putative Type IV pilus modification protein PilV [Crenothrix polyspora]
MLDHQKARGFTLIEVLVSTIILAIGLLGLAAMQTLALKDNQDAFFYSQASTLAYEMSDRIKVNRNEWSDPLGPTSMDDADFDCSNLNTRCNFTNQCTPAQMAKYDYCAWKANVQNRLGGTGVVVTVTQPPSATGVCMGAPNVCITISWNRNHTKSTNTTNTFRLDITP